jgi:hypothetical protein
LQVEFQTTFSGILYTIPHKVCKNRSCRIELVLRLFHMTCKSFYNPLCATHLCLTVFIPTPGINHDELGAGVSVLFVPNLDALSFDVNDNPEIHSAKHTHE